MNKKIRIIREEAEETFQLTVGDLKRIINEELGRLDEQANNPSAVKAVQAALNMLGYPQAHIGSPLAVDGDYGRQTKEMVEDFQAAAGLQVDGAVGPATAAELQRELQKIASSDAIGDTEAGDADDDETKTPVDKSTGRKPVQRKKSPEEFVGSEEVVKKIESAANDTSRFKDPVMAAATLKKFAEQGDRELLAALIDMADRGGRRVQQRSIQIAKDLTGILAKTRPENREELKQRFLNQLKSDASEMADRLKIASFRPRTNALDSAESIAESINEQLNPSGDSQYTLDVVGSLLDKVRNEKMVLRRRRRRKAKPAEKPAVSAPNAEKPAVGEPSSGDDTPPKPLPKLISKSEIASIAKYLASDAFGQFGYPASSKEDPKDTNPYAKQKVPGVWEKAKSDIERVIKAGQIKDLAVAYEEEEDDPLMGDILYWLNQARKQTGSRGRLDNHVKFLKNLYGTTRTALNKHDNATALFAQGPVPE